MAAKALNLSRPPIARPVSVDTAFGGTFAANQIEVTGPELFASEGYLMFASGQPADQVSVVEIWPTVTMGGEALADVRATRLIVGEQTLVTSGTSTAATCSRTYLPHRRGFYPNVSLRNSEFWWTGAQFSGSLSIRIRDTRLEPFFERLVRIEHGDWDGALGKMPNARAREIATAVLDQLEGGFLTPKKLVGGDGLLAFYFTNGPRYSTIEVLNSGSTLLMNSDGQTVPEVLQFKMADLSVILEKVRAHIS